jgi:hypothetical protein
MSTPLTLEEIGIKHACTKSRVAHGYLEVCEPYLAPWRDQPLTLLELGVCEGKSLRVWREYFPHATVVGVDIDPPTLDLPGCHFHRGDQQDTRFLEGLIETYGAFDLIIDDASHVGSATIHAFESLWPALQPGGLYLVEDLQTSYQSAFGPVSFIDWAFERVHDLNFRGKSGYAHLPNLPGPEYDRLVPQLTRYERELAALHCLPFLMIFEKSRGKLR